MTTLPIGSPRPAGPPEALDEDPPLFTVMSRDVVSIDAEARLPTALQVMVTTGVRHLPVVDRGRVLGVLVETDLIRCLGGEGHRLATAAMITLRQLYRPAPELPPTARVSDAARHMFADVSGGVLVTDNGRVLGIVTATDLVRLLARRDTRHTP
jgi:CBS domain-containing protein